MKGRKTKGSSMLLIISIFGILSIVGTSMLAAMTANYKLRIQENDRVKNLYSAESGIDKAYLSLIDEVKAAINIGKNEAEAEKNKNKTIAEKNEIFKNKYLLYLNNNLNYIEEPFDITGGEALVSCNLEDVDGTFTETLTTKVATLTSKYTDNKGKERAVSVSYNINIPTDYITVGSGDIESMINYSIATDGNLNIDNSYVNDELTMVGDIWVKGIRNTGMYENPIMFKYDGGINILNSQIEFENDVITASNLKVENSEIEIDDDNAGRIFAENILLGSAIEANDEGNAELDAEDSDIYIANDLVLTSSKASASIANLYGFNDVNLIEDGNEVRGSSSIIINNTKWPISSEYNVNVNKNAYIMGSAYIKTNEDIYQTGESVAIKGNYKAYTYPLGGKYDETQYVYLDPLVLIDKDKNGELLSVGDKAVHFESVANNETLRNELSLKLGGIMLPKDKTYTAGAAISNEKATGTSYSLAKEEDIRNQKSEFVKHAYYMGDENFNVDQFENGEPDMNHTVEKQINWSATDTLESVENDLYYKKVVGDLVIILSNDKNTTIKITRGSKNKTIAIKKGDFIKEEKVNNSKQILLINRGVVQLDNVQGFDGVILSVGNIDMNGCRYDVGSAKKLGTIIEENKAILAPIFTVTSGSGSIETPITAENLISKEKWTLIK